eukprot:CAMPEP_0197248536 /NCGR_PEP_ID=MMETSP1429-20130617/40098_1 /TAXON_ID=49237 /ORGANISM="Chaetoceros  sp., Strain UNC1202" /LENGTH=81 /DNA_ID=CAMNT_0042709787 /DNA_START=116 /DNA_END=358 /DNA_ORIENTATION=-
MMNVAESRHRRLQHYVNPDEFPLLEEDEVDPEDCKTELFGADAEKIVSAKKEEVNRTRIKGRTSHRFATIQRKPAKQAKVF